MSNTGYFELNNEFYFIYNLDNLIINIKGKNKFDYKEDIKEFNSIEEAGNFLKSEIASYIGSGFKEVKEAENKYFCIDKVNIIDITYKAIKKFNLEKYALKILPCAIRAIRILTTKEDKYFKKGNSRFCGLPDFPPGFEFPRNKEGKLYQFLCQISLEQISYYNHLLPKEGILYFFIEKESDLSAGNKIIFFKGNRKSVSKYKFDGKVSDTDFIDTECGAKYLDTPYRVVFEEVVSLPKYMDKLYKSFNLSSEDANKYLDMVAFLEKNEKDCHYMFNYPLFQANDPRDMNGSEREHNKKGICLLQLKSDEHVNFCFLDSGDLNFVIEQEDLKNLNFDNVVSAIEAS